MITKDDFEIFNTLSKLEEKVNFINKIIFPDDDYSDLEYLLSLEDEDEDDFELDIEIFNDINDFIPESESDIISIYLYNIINNKSNAFIDLKNSKDFNIVILEDCIYIGYSKKQDLDYFKTKKILNNNLIAVTENKEIPSLIKPYLNSKYVKVYKVLGFLEGSISMS